MVKELCIEKGVLPPPKASDLRIVSDCGGLLPAAEGLLSISWEEGRESPRCRLGTKEILPKPYLDGFLLGLEDLNVFTYRQAYFVNKPPVLSEDDVPLLSIPAFGPCLPGVWADGAVIYSQAGRISSYLSPGGPLRLYTQKRPKSWVDLPEFSFLEGAQRLLSLRIQVYFQGKPLSFSWRGEEGLVGALGGVLLRQAFPRTEINCTNTPKEGRWLHLGECLGFRRVVGNYDPGLVLMLEEFIPEGLVLSLAREFNKTTRLLAGFIDD